MLLSISKELGNVRIPYYNGELSMIPFNLNNVSTLPLEFIKTVENMISNLKIKVGTAYLTVHGQEVKKDNTLRRGKAHIDGNYLPLKCGWGSGGGNGWKVGQDGHQLNTPDHILSYENTKGGMLIASNYMSSKGWNGQFEGKAGIGGDCSHLKLNEGFKLKANKVYYGNSQFIHESLPVDRDVHRVMFRITLPITHEFEV